MSENMNIRNVRTSFLEFMESWIGALGKQRDGTPCTSYIVTPWSRPKVPEWILDRSNAEEEFVLPSG